MKLITLPNKKLREISKEVVFPINDEDKQIIKKMINHIDESQKPNSLLREGIGIAAVQLGYLKRMFYVNIPDSSLSEPFKDFLINPEIISESITPVAIKYGEGCLSVNEKDDVDGLVHRKFKIVIKGYSWFAKKEVEYVKTGFIACVFQHEMDHLNGQLYIDRVNKEKPFEKLENEEIIE